MKFLALLAATMLAATPTFAQDAGAPSANATGPAAKIQEGTEFPVRLEEAISSKSASTGDRFTISLSEDVHLPNGVILRAGYKGIGEVLDAEKTGMLGKTGKLAIRLNYIRVGDQRIKLRASRDTQGSHNTAVQVGALLLLWPVVPFIKGNGAQIKKGTQMTGYANSSWPSCRYEKRW